MHDFSSIKVSPGDAVNLVGILSHHTDLVYAVAGERQSKSTLTSPAQGPTNHGPRHVVLDMDHGMLILHPDLLLSGLCGRYEYYFDV
jgi:hypothetical protein